MRSARSYRRCIVAIVSFLALALGTSRGSTDRSFVPPRSNVDAIRRRSIVESMAAVIAMSPIIALPEPSKALSDDNKLFSFDMPSGGPMGTLKRLKGEDSPWPGVVSFAGTEQEDGRAIQIQAGAITGRNFLKRVMATVGEPGQGKLTSYRREFGKDVDFWEFSAGKRLPFVWPVAHNTDSAIVAKPETRFPTHTWYKILKKDEKEVAVLAIVVPESNKDFAQAKIACDKIFDSFKLS